MAWPYTIPDIVVDGVDDMTAARWNSGVVTPLTEILAILGTNPFAAAGSLENWIAAEHNDDGTHSTITATSITTSGNASVGGNVAVVGTLQSAATTILVTSSLTNTHAILATWRHNTSGTPAASFAIRHLYQLESSTTEDQDAAAFDVIATTATHSSFTTAIRWLLRNSGAALAEYMRLTPTGLGILTTPVTGMTLTVPEGSTAALNLSGTSGTLTSGIRFATDTNWYRAAAGALATSANSGANTPTICIISTDTTVEQDQVVGRFQIETNDASSGGTGIAMQLYSIATDTFGTQYDAVLHSKHAANEWEVSRWNSIGLFTLTRREVASTGAIQIGGRFDHWSSGVPTAGHGSRYDMRLEADDDVMREAVSITAVTVTATDGSRKYRGILSAWDTAQREAIRFEASGSAAMLGFYGASAVAKQTVTGSRGGNAALASLLTALATLGLITDSTS